MYFIDKKEFAEMEIGRWAGGKIETDIFMSMPGEAWYDAGIMIRNYVHIGWEIVNISWDGLAFYLLLLYRCLFYGKELGS